jgi:hypothetical protein
MRLNFHNNYHLGDAVWHVHYLRKMHERYPKAVFNFYINKNYLNEIRTQLTDYADYISVQPIEEKTNDSIDCWLGRERFVYKYPTPTNYLNILVEFYKYLSRFTGVISPVENFIFDNPRILKSTPLSNKVDVLVINSEPFSGQWDYQESVWDKKITQWRDSGKRVITTKKSKVSGVECTTDYGLGLMDIANLSTTAKIVGGVHTSPLLACFNRWSLPSVEKFFVCDVSNHLPYNDNTVFIRNNEELLAI